jgi:hypothetical protein
MLKGISLSLLLALPASVLLAQEDEAGALDGFLPSMICIQRYEDSGIMNVTSSNVSVTYEGRRGPAYNAWIGGGQALCFLVMSGPVVVKAQSYELYNPNSTDPAACKSNDLTIDVAEHKRYLTTIGRTGDTSGLCWTVSLGDVK